VVIAKMVYASALAWGRDSGVWVLPKDSNAWASDVLMVVHERVPMGV
jgi:hypothetical protein